MLDDVLAIPDHLRDALWRVESARLERPTPPGSLVCGMGGSAIGGDLAAAGARRAPQPAAGHGPRLRPAELGRARTGPCSARATRAAPRRRSPASRPRPSVGARRIVVGTGGTLVDRAREEGVPVVGLPGILQPRGCGRLHGRRRDRGRGCAGAAPRIAGRDRGAPRPFLERRRRTSRPRAAEIAARLEGTLPVVVRRRADRSRSRGAGRPRSTRTRSCRRSSRSCPRPTTTRSAVGPACPRERASRWSLLEDAEQHPRLRRPLRAHRRGDRRDGHRGRAGADRGADARGPTASGR